MRGVKVAGLIGIVAVGMAVFGLFLPAYGAQKTAEAYVTQGGESLKDGKFEEAIDSLTKALKLSPKSVNALNTRGIAYCKKGDIDKAIADFSRAIKINPKFGKAYNNRPWPCGPWGNIAKLRQT